MPGSFCQIYSIQATARSNVRALQRPLGSFPSSVVSPLILYVCDVMSPSWFPSGSPSWCTEFRWSLEMCGMWISLIFASWSSCLVANVAYLARFVCLSSLVENLMVGLCCNQTPAACQLDLTITFPRLQHAQFKWANNENIDCGWMDELFKVIWMEYCKPIPLWVTMDSKGLLQNYGTSSQERVLSWKCSLMLWIEESYFPWFLKLSNNKRSTKN